MSPRTVAAAVLVVTLVVFIFENTARTEIRFILPKVRAPLWAALLVSTVVGVAIGMLISRRDRRR